MIKQFLLLSLAILLLGVQAPATAQEELIEQLGPFQPFLGKTWKGEFKHSTKEKPMFDVSRWERALNGNAVRVLHSVNDGEYGGETIMFWDKAKQSLVFYYFTTAGFYTTGTLTIAGSKFTSHEYVTGNSNGITEVKGTGEVTPEGKMVSKSQYLQNGKWVEGHEIIYVEDATAQVVFK